MAGTEIPPRIAITAEAEARLRELITSDIPHESQRKAAFAVIQDRFIDASDLSTERSDPLQGFRQRFYVAAYHYAKEQGRNALLERGESLEKVIAHAVGPCEPSNNTFEAYRKALQCRFPNIKTYRAVRDTKLNATVPLPGATALIMVHPQELYASEADIVTGITALTASMSQNQDMPIVYLYNELYKSVATDTGGYYLSPAQADHIVESWEGSHNVLLSDDVQTVHFGGGKFNGCLRDAVISTVGHFVERPSAKELTIVLHAPAIYEARFTDDKGHMTQGNSTLSRMLKIGPYKVRETMIDYLNDIYDLLTRTHKSAIVHSQGVPPYRLPQPGLIRATPQEIKDGSFLRITIRIDNRAVISQP